MTERKFTPPTKFPAEYVDGRGGKAVILGRGPHEMFPFIGHDAAGHARYWTEEGLYSTMGANGYELHDIPKRITTWHNVYSGADVAGGYCSRQGADHVLISGRTCVYRIERDEDGGNPEIFVEDV